jgi:hypothetical protein
MGIVPSARRCVSRMRPRFQVIMSRKSMMPRTSGTQPPFCTFTRFAARNATSTMRKMLVTVVAFHDSQRKRSRATTSKSNVVMNIVPVTAMPYAAPRLEVFLNATTTRRHPTAMNQLTSGI